MSFINNKDHHISLKTDVIGETRIDGIEWKLVRLQYSKVDIGFSLHANPTSFTTAGVQTTDYLQFLGFTRNKCSFSSGEECFSTFVVEDFNLQEFTKAFSEGFDYFEEAEKRFASCGLYFDRPEGVSFHFRKTPKGKYYSENRYNSSGDGHTSSKMQTLKKSEDEYFYFILTYIDNQEYENKGFVIHYQPKHPPLSIEFQRVMSFFKIKKFSECPVFSFDECFWWFIKLEKNESSISDTTAEYAYSSFNSHETNFSEGARLIIQSDAKVRIFGFKLLPFDNQNRTTQLKNLLGSFKIAAG